jgi:hypothetical protein
VGLLGGRAGSSSAWAGDPVAGPGSRHDTFRPEASGQAGRLVSRMGVSHFGLPPGRRRRRSWGLTAVTALDDQGAGKGDQGRGQ